jgi:hypothetical protein
LTLHCQYEYDNTILSCVCGSLWTIVLTLFTFLTFLTLFTLFTFLTLFTLFALFALFTLFALFALFTLLILFFFDLFRFVFRSRDEWSCRELEYVRLLNKLFGWKKKHRDCREVWFVCGGSSLTPAGESFITDLSNGEWLPVVAASGGGGVRLTSFTFLLHFFYISFFRHAAAANHCGVGVPSMVVSVLVSYLCRTCVLVSLCPWANFLPLLFITTTACCHHCLLPPPLTTTTYHHHILPPPLLVATT